MASGKVSKNSTKGSKPKVMEIEKKVRPKKETILVEVDKNNYSQIKESGLLEYEGKQILECLRRFGKTYIKLSNI